ncbi:MAG TPA: NAD-dependent epimerase/dehydratase family protein [Sandaracinaceae bacterium LLY-WYZ-13_1]|nr:NAD-dependent epimerase/dehydratase family protein [Sandaracinaceae bacterium LLY-WYZ-13_1]
MARVLIVGCGTVGEPLGMRLAATGHLVWGLRRDPSSLPVSFTHVQADVLVPNTLRRLPDVDVVYYLVRPDRADARAARQAHVDGVGYLLEVMRRMRLRPRRLFYGSCVDVYGDRGGDWVDEDSALAPDALDDATRALVEGEARVREAKIPSTVVRLGHLYGPGHPGLLGEALEPAGPFPAPRRHASLLHLDDAAGALAHLVGVERPAPTYVVADREPSPRGAIAAWLTERAGRPMPELCGATPPPGADVRPMSERLVESGYRFVHPSYREGFGALLSKVAGR